MFSYCEIVEKLGIPVKYLANSEILKIAFREKKYINNIYHMANRDVVIGDPPETSVALCKLNDRIEILCSKDTPENNSSIVNLLIHEACHAVLGLASLDDEGMTIAYEWNVMKFLNKNDYIHARKTFGINQFNPDPKTPMEFYEIGTFDDSFQESPGWKLLENMCVESGFLNADMTPVWNIGISPSFSNYIHKLESYDCK